MKIYKITRHICVFFGTLFFLSLSAQDSLRILTWNIQNFGKSKDADEIAFIARQVRHFDIVAVQEVSVGEAGAKAVAWLADELNRTGASWDYRISDPTTGEGSERYAWLWKKSKVRNLGRCGLEQGLADSINREPFFCRFVFHSDTLMLGTFHAVPTSKGPAREIAFLHQIHKWHPQENIFIMGDFNLSEKNPAFLSLKNLGYQPAVKGSKTSLRMEVKDGSVLANEYDNIFFNERKVVKVSAGTINFTPNFPTLKEAREISDHIPVWLTIKVRQ